MKKVWNVLLVATLVLMGLPVGTQAQVDLEEVEIFTDPEGDLEISSSGQNVPNNGGRFYKSDLTGLYLEESQEQVTFRVQVRDVDPDPTITFVEQGLVMVEFVLGDPETELVKVGEGGSSDQEDQGTTPDDEGSAIDQYAVEIYHYDGGANAYLSKYDPTLDRYARVASYCSFCEKTVQVDPERESWLIEVPKDQLLDSQGAALHPGLPLHDFYVHSEGIFYDSFSINGDGGFLDIYDQMPDDGEPSATVTPQLGVQQTGHLRLSSPAPVRASNGEATTYVYDITLDSDADFADDVALSVTGAPESWEVKLPADSVRIDNDTNIHLPVVVTTPFGHKHGSFESFIVEAQSSRDPAAVGRVELGVRYTEIPQPAGHHSRLWFHSSVDATSNTFQEAFNTVGFAQPSEYAYFNAAEGDDDSTDQAVDVPPNSGGGFGINQDGMPATNYDWDIYLEPTLQMGLDFDINQTGELTLPFKSQAGLRDATIEGTLYYLRAGDVANRFFPEDDAIVLGQFEQSEPQSGSVGQTVEFTTTFTPAPESDFLLYEPSGASVWMEIELETVAPTTFIADRAIEPVLVPGGIMDLPLNEYHDPVDELYNQLTDVDVIMDGDQEQFVNSGETILFEVRIHNTGVVNDEFQLIMGGVNSDWAELLGDESFKVRSGESRRVVVAVTAPMEASNGETADLVLEAISKSDDNARALVRLFAEVDNLVDHEDKSHLIPVHSEELTYTPVGAWLAPTALLGALAFMRRTRRL